MRMLKNLNIPSVFFLPFSLFVYLCLCLSVSVSVSRSLFSWPPPFFFYISIHFLTFSSILSISLTLLPSSILSHLTSLFLSFSLSSLSPFLSPSLSLFSTISVAFSSFIPIFPLPRSLSLLSMLCPFYPLWNNSILLYFNFYLRS